VTQFESMHPRPDPLGVRPLQRFDCFFTILHDKLQFRFQFRIVVL
jgi:hypothetical protein